MSRTLASAMSLALVLHQVACGQEWARNMFPVRSHSFGVVARGAKTQFAFEVQNRYAVEVHIASVRTSCGCTTPSITKPTLRTYEKGAILATFNTGSFLGDRKATLTVTFDKPRYAEVQLQVRGRIRGDVEVVPSGVSFGAVDQGRTASRTIEVRRFGGGNWKIREVRSSSDFISAEVLPTRLSSGQTAYRLTARLKEGAPVGYFNDQLTLVTNDRTMPYLPVHVDGQIVAPVTVSPAALFLGTVPPGQKVTRKIVVRAKQPFKIVGVRPEDDRFSFKLDDTAKTVHIVPLTFTAGSEVAKVVETVTVETDLGTGVTASCKVSAAVVEPVASN